ncbi:hypothetical protein ACFL20_11530 [Spirochaetota bacterium]
MIDKKILLEGVDFIRVNKDFSVKSAMEAKKQLKQDYQKFTVNNKVGNKTAELIFVSLKQLVCLMDGIIEDLQALCEIKDNILRFNGIKTFSNDKYIFINMDLFEKAFSEILINTIEYSKPETDISIKLSVRNMSAEISVINDPISPKNKTV